jgi:hypothetical protein
MVDLKAVRETEGVRNTLPGLVRAKAFFRRAQVRRQLDEYE